MNAKPQQTYVFFNNDHAMLKNSREMLAILNRLLYDWTRSKTCTASAKTSYGQHRSYWSVLNLSVTKKMKPCIYLESELCKLSRANLHQKALFPHTVTTIYSLATLIYFIIHILINYRQNFANETYRLLSNLLKSRSNIGGFQPWAAPHMFLHRLKLLDKCWR